MTWSCSRSSIRRRLLPTCLHDESVAQRKHRRSLLAVRDTISCALDVDSRIPGNGSSQKRACVENLFQGDSTPCSSRLGTCKGISSSHAVCREAKIAGTTLGSTPALRNNPERRGEFRRIRAVRSNAFRSIMNLWSRESRRYVYVGETHSSRRPRGAPRDVESSTGPSRSGRSSGASTTVPRNATRRSVATGKAPFANFEIVRGIRRYPPSRSAHAGATAVSSAPLPRAPGRSLTRPLLCLNDGVCSEHDGVRSGLSLSQMSTSTASRPVRLALSGR